MTEAEWTTCRDPIAMIEYLRGSPVGQDSISWGNNRWQLDEIPKGDDRKFRLFACHCCRRIWDRIPEAVNRDAVVAVEGFLEGYVSGDEVRAALSASSSVEYYEDGSGRRTERGYWVVKTLGRGFYKMTAAASALMISSAIVCMADADYGSEAGSEFRGCYYTAGGVFLSPFAWPQPMPPSVEAECSAQADVLRCLFPNPFRPTAISPEWFTPDVVQIARGIYDDKAFDRLPILSDALTDAGCEDPEIIDHCRCGSSHVRGCWLIDLLLDKA